MSKYYVIDDRLIVICSGFMSRAEAHRWIIKNGGEWKPWFIGKEGDL
jgi:hypothetical protein